ncbi:TLC domain-containing protein 2 [Meriones unguiculatus]|uniref:TLC domain-containing protein 2 n=1 Tax=Meriones unguiculatus TaxID=10047 RepID=UPI000B4FB338|nr:TLC domain-containing protein 2 [Meriones unguiculatus]
MASWGLLAAGASFLAFRGLHQGLRLLPTPESTRDRWMWRNIFVSLIHSLLSGAGAVVGLWLYPQMVTDQIHGHPFWPQVLVAVSVGYFLADGVDMLRNQTLAQAWDLLCHHLVVVSCFSTVVLSGRFVGIALVSLLLELNSVCLHLRKLLLLSHKASSLAFRVISWASLTTLALFRLLPLGWMSLWLFRQCSLLSCAKVILYGTALVTVGRMSISLGTHILIRDVLQAQPYPFVLVHKTQQTKTGEPVSRNNSTRSLKD